MMQITSITRQKRNQSRYSVYVDGEYAFAVGEEEFFKLNLYDKKEITAEEIEYIKETVNFREAKQAAIKYMGLKLRSGEEVRIRLQNSGYDKNTISKVLTELKSLGYINDELYAQKYLYDRSKLKPQSKKLLRINLLKKGLDESIIENVLQQWEQDDETAAESIARKKFGKYDLSDGRINLKARQFLYRKGFAEEVVESVINKML